MSLGLDSRREEEVRVVGFGLAGACVALQLLQEGKRVRVLDDGKLGSSVVAAGLVNPVAGRNFEPSWQVREALEVALPFYDWVGEGLFREVPILRLWIAEKDRAKFERKFEVVKDWVAEVNEEGVLWKGGGWLNCPAFLKRAKEKFLEMGGEFVNELDGEAIWCAGAAGLLRGDFEGVAHRCAKGEILTVKIEGWGEERILNRSGWVIPLGDDLYRVGATYAWDGFDRGPTEEGRKKVEEILRSFTGRGFEVVEHVAGVRPIIQNSKPMVIYQKGKGWMVNGLGSKGVIYAPRLFASLTF